MATSSGCKCGSGCLSLSWCDEFPTRRSVQVSYKMETSHYSAPATSKNLDDSSELRTRAVGRAWICPGAGFALVGSERLATSIFAFSLTSIPVVGYLVVRPSGFSFWATVVLLGISILFFVAEQIGVKKFPLQPSAPAFLVRGYVPSSCLMYIAVALLVVIIVTSYGKFRMAGSGMQPTLEHSEMLIYHKRWNTQEVRPGRVIVYRNSTDSNWGEPDEIVVSRVLASPGDTISINNESYLVNGIEGPPVSATGDYLVAIDIPAAPDEIQVPEDCFFMVPDSPTNGLDSRVLSWARRDNVVGTQLWRFGLRGIFERIE